MGEFVALYQVAQGPKDVGELETYVTDQGYCNKRIVNLKTHQEMALNWMRKAEQSARKGGILADGPGLGKTITTLSCIVTDESSPTLIICPNKVLLNHWIRELHQRFVPNALSVEIYDGLPTNTTATDAEPFIKRLKHTQLTLITISTLIREYNYYIAQQGGRKPFKCPLYHVNWHRVCVDEVQEVEGAASAAAKMARIIPSRLRWGISGTPITRGLVDLAGMAQFLQIQPFCQSEWWKLNRNSIPQLQKLIQTVMWRTPYVIVAEYLKLPQQIHLPPTFIRVSAIEYATTRPMLDEYFAILRRRIFSFKQDYRPLSKQDLRRLLANPVFLAACKSATFGATTQEADAVEYFTRLAAMRLNKVYRQAIACSTIYEEIEFPWPHLQDREQFYKQERLDPSLSIELSCREHLYFMMRFMERQGYAFQPLESFQLLSVLHERPGLYVFQSYKLALFPIERMLPREVWQQIYAFLPPDYDLQRKIVFRKAVDHVYGELFRYPPVIWTVQPVINFDCEPFRTEIGKYGS